MKVLVSGAAGQLGRESVTVLAMQHEVTALTSQQLDITDPARVDEVLRLVKPDVVLNCAAYTRVDDCERNTDLAWKVNVEGPRNLARGIALHGGRLVHVSTDYVFDGSKPLPQAYDEDDEPAPLSFYGTTKHESERAICAVSESHLIIRTAWMYGAYGQNFLKAVLRRAVQDPLKEIRIVNDRFGSPTWAYRLALQIEKLIAGRYRGIWHAAAEGYCSWYELACCFLNSMGVPHAAVPCSGSEYPAAAPRPVNSILENRNLKRAGINLMRDWKADVAQFVRMFRSVLLEETGRSTA